MLSWEAQTLGTLVQLHHPDSGPVLSHKHLFNPSACRRLARKQREAEWAAFNATRPDEGHEDQADLLAIRQAETSMGDFKLKSDPNYVAPEVDLHTLSAQEVGGLVQLAGKGFSFVW